jgi:leucyl aminopeptidase
VLALYKYDKYITVKKAEAEITLKEISFFRAAAADEKNIKKAVKAAEAIYRAVTFARDLANAPGNEVFPEVLAERAEKMAKEHKLGITVLGRKEIKELGMGGILGVSAGSEKPPRFLIVEHNKGKENLDTIVLVGKGVTFDSGGISIKPSSGMDEMKLDMSGAAAVLGAMQAIADLDLPLHVVGLTPLVENMPSGSAMRPGDILTAMNGKTIEVDNTDAEGRLILADALAYAERYKPKTVIDLATLTGACVVALAQFATGMMGTDEATMEKLKKVGEKTHERVWQLPIYDDYDKLIKSNVADVKNTGGRWGGAITAAMFLKRFIGEYPWVHLDIAGTAMLEEATDYEPKGGSGVGVRLLVELLRNWKME